MRCIAKVGRPLSRLGLPFRRQLLKEVCVIILAHMSRPDLPSSQSGGVCGCSLISCWAEARGSCRCPTRDSTCDAAVDRPKLSKLVLGNKVSILIELSEGYRGRQVLSIFIDCRLHYQLTTAVSIPAATG